MPLTGFAANQYGHAAAAGVCDTCGRDYQVMPIPPVDHWRCWRNCLRPDCDSYDIERDADLWFEPLAEHGQIGRSEADDLEEEL